MTHFHSVPEKGDAIVMLTNSQNSWPFFAYMLRDWAKWCGYTNPGMTRILLGNHILRAIIVLLLVLTLWVFWVFLEDMVAKKRRFAPFSPVTPVRRTLQILISLLTAGLLIWAASQDYLFVSSVFPLTSKYLGMVLIFFSPVLMLNALFPRKT